MADNLIEIRETNSGDWIEIIYDGNIIFEGHSIDLQKLLEACGFTVSRTTLPDDYP